MKTNNEEMLKESKEKVMERVVQLKGSSNPELMKLLKIKPGPKIGLLLNALLAEVFLYSLFNKE